MNEENVKRIIDMVQKGIDTAGEKLGVGVPHLWEILIRQQYINAVSCSVVWLVLFCINVGGWVIGFKLSKHEEEASAYIIFGSFIFSMILLLFFIFGLGEVIGMLFNPEYYAILKVVEFIK